MIKVPVVGGIGLGNLDVSEKWMIAVMRRLELLDDGVFVDIGVNIGQTLIKLKSVYPTMEYLGFEPNPECVSYTQKLIDKNEWKKTNLIPSGISEKTGILEINYFSQDPTDSSASIVPDFREENAVERTSYVACHSVADISNLFIGNVSAVKIDVEGAECEVLRSLWDVLQQHRPFMLVEILPVYSPDNSARLDPQLEIEKMLDELGYTKYRIHKNSNGEFSHFESIASIGVHDKIEWCDYLFSPLKNDIADQ